MSEPSSTEASVDLLLRRFGARASFVPVREDDVFVRTSRGRLELIDRCSPRPRRLRMLLTLIDGRVSVAELRRGVRRGGRAGLYRVTPRWPRQGRHHSHCLSH